MLAVTEKKPAVICCAQQAPTGWNAYVAKRGYAGFHLRSEWAEVFSAAMCHRPWFLWTEQDGRISGVLPLMHISGPLFGSFLVSQPYLNTGGVLADTCEAQDALIGAAAALADDLDVKHLELRHELAVEHDRLNALRTEKVHLRLALPASGEALWEGLKSKLRSQLRKPLQDQDLSFAFGQADQLDAFYRVFCHNMRDLGTPPFPRRLFEEMLRHFGEAAEICVVRVGDEPAAAGLLLHAPGTTLIPSASALRRFSATSCNMLLYWQCLKRSIERGQTVFDFGRSSRESGTYRFKRQWGAEEQPTAWQYYLRRGNADDLRPNNGRYDDLIAIWQRLPVWLTRLLGPAIVRGIP